MKINLGQIMKKGLVMQMNNKPGLLIAALFMVIMIGVICVMSVGRAAEYGYTFQIFDFSFGRSAVLQNTIELSTEEVSSLQLEYSSKNIRVYPTSGENITIREYLYSNRPEAQAKVTYQENNEVIVVGGRVQTLVLFGFGINGGERIEVYVPEKALKALSIQTGSGNITGEHDCVARDGKLAVKAGSGNIKWSGTDASEASFQAGSGNVKIDDIKGNVKVETGSGNITLTDYEGKGTIAAKSGNVNVEAVSVTGDIEMQTNSGNIKLKVPEELKFHLEVNTGSGSIHTDFDEVLSYNKKGNYAEGDVGDTPEICIHMKAGSGNVKVLEQ